jgi:NAD(P)-dependent dehydrogenase (short-subunit alcohol dehydrogenase family)
MARQVVENAMDSLTGKLAVVTGGRLGIGRELVRQLAAHGCSVATCDINPDAVAATVWACARPGVAVTGRACDVSDQAQVLRFRDELLEQHEHDYADLVFANAGVFGGASFVKDSPEEWERTFNIIWLGVYYYYYCARVFLPLLIASGDGVLVNTSSVSGFWPTAGAGQPVTAYSAANFAIKGLPEALVEDLRCNAPQVRVVVVMPGVVNTDIAENSRRALGLPELEQHHPSSGGGLRLQP